MRQGLLGVQSTYERLLNLGAALMYKHLVSLPAVRDMKAACRQHGLEPPDLGHSSVAAGIYITDWAFEVPQPVPPKTHVSCTLQTCLPEPCLSCCVGMLNNAGRYLWVAAQFKLNTMHIKWHSDA